MSERLTSNIGEGWQAPKTEGLHLVDKNRSETERQLEEEKVFKTWEEILKDMSPVAKKGTALPNYRGGTWNRNNDVLAAVNSKGQLFVIPYTEGRAQQLETLGFEKDGKIGVPFSTSEPTDPNQKERWDKLSIRQTNTYNTQNPDLRMPKAA